SGWSAPGGTGASTWTPWPPSWRAASESATPLMRRPPARHPPATTSTITTTTTITITITITATIRRPHDRHRQPTQGHPPQRRAAFPRRRLRRTRQPLVATRLHRAGFRRLGCRDPTRPHQALVHADQR